MRVLNCHHFKGVENLPPNTKYIGRPSKYGNPYARKDTKRPSEENVGLHRLKLYTDLKDKVITLEELRADLGAGDIACWCKHPKYPISCHGDNFVHVLREDLASRDYTGTAIFYLMDDLRSAIDRLHLLMGSDVKSEDWMNVYLSFQDMLIDLKHVLHEAKVRQLSFSDVARSLSFVVIDLEMAFEERDPACLDFRFLHVLWTIGQFERPFKTRDGEPKHPRASKSRGS